MDHSSEMRRCLEACDVEGVRRLWAHVSPHLPAPANDRDALVAIHMARTLSEAMGLIRRAYSHRWLSDHGYPSQLPDHLKPKAERMYPRIVEAVGIAVKAPEHRRAGALLIRGAMEQAVLEAHADGKLSDATFVRARMAEAHSRATKQLYG